MIVQCSIPVITTGKSSVTWLPYGAYKVLENSLLLAILLILAGGKILGIIAEKFGLPSLVGELLIGVILGPTMLGIIHSDDPALGPSLGFLANLGILFMMFIMGLSIDVESVIKANARNATSITLIGAGMVFIISMLVTLMVGILLGQDFYYSLAQACLIGVGLTSTSTVIGFKFLSDIGDRFSKVFKTLVAVEVTDGIFSIMLLAIFLSIIGIFRDMETGSDVAYNSVLSTIGWSSFNLFLLILGFMIFVIKFGGRVTDWLLGVSKRSHDDQSIITLSLIILFAVAGLSDWLHLTSVIGAFLAGAILAGSPYSETIIAPRIKALGYGLFIPIFFAYTGVQMNFGTIFGGKSIPVAGGFGIPCYFVLFLGLLITVMACKYFGARAGCALNGGYKDIDSRRIGFSLMCIGEDTLVVAQIGTVVYFSKDMPLVTPEIYSVLGLLIIISSILTPLFLKRTFEEKSYNPPIPHGRTRSKIRSL